MRKEQLLAALGNVDEGYIAEMYEQEKKPHRQLSTRRVWLIAAVIAVMVLMMGCALVFGPVIAESDLFQLPLVTGTDVEQDAIQLTVSDVTATSMRVHCTVAQVQEGEAAVYILSDGPFALEKQTEEGWEQLPIRYADPEWDAGKVLTNGDYDWKVDWSAVYGVLESGTYRYTAVVLEGVDAVSVEFTVEADPDAGRDALKAILDGEYYCIRVTYVTEFGSSDHLSVQDQATIEMLRKEYGPRSSEYWKYGEDLLILGYKEERLNSGMMYRDGIKYKLDHEGDSNDLPLAGWSQWPDLNMNRLTDWVTTLMETLPNARVEYSPEGELERFEMVDFADNYAGAYDVDVTFSETWEFIRVEPDAVAEKFAEQNVDTAREFSWAEEQEEQKALDVAFVNTTTQPVATASEAIARAMAECTVDHDKIIVYRDEAAGMWKVEFQIQYGYQGYQFIYLDDDGITQMISGAGSKVEAWKDSYPDP